MRVILGEDELLLREGLSLILERNGFEVVATARTADELVELAVGSEPDLVVTDIRMPPTFTVEGLRGALTIRNQNPTLPLVVLSQYVQRRYALELLEHPTAGTGYLLKQRIANTSKFCSDLRQIHAGHTILDPEVADLIVARSRTEHQAVELLTRRQHEVLALMAQGRSNASIGRELTITDKAVVRHVSNIYDVLGLPPDADDHRRVLAVIRYLSP